MKNSDKTLQREDKEVLAVKELGEQIGYGHMMLIAHALWARELEERYGTREGAWVPANLSDVKEGCRKGLDSVVYKHMVDKALALSKTLVSEGTGTVVIANSASTRIGCECKICKEFFSIDCTNPIFPICDSCLETLKKVVEREENTK